LRFSYIIILALTSCSLFEEPHWDIETDLSVWVEKFYTEAEKRGKIIQRQYLTVQFDGHIKYAGVSERGRHIVKINSAFFYQHFTINKDSFAVEYVVFHELGHALMDKRHVDSYAIMNNCCKTLNVYTHKDSADFRVKMMDKLFK
jgi:Zn-dependent peptidase ImmA (M78 family)